MKNYILPAFMLLGGCAVQVGDQNPFITPGNLGLSFFEGKESESSKFEEAGFSKVEFEEGMTLVSCQTLVGEGKKMRHIVRTTEERIIEAKRSNGKSYLTDCGEYNSHQVWGKTNG